jgi:hypothetical protein
VPFLDCQVLLTKPYLIKTDQAGIRLAGELNRLLAGQKVKAVIPSNPPVATPNTVSAVPAQVKLEEVKNNIGKIVTVSGKVFSSRDIGSMVLVNLSAAYPNQLLTVALKEKPRLSRSDYEQECNGRRCGD